MTNQEAFEKMVLHLRKQGAKATVVPGRGLSSCMYRAPNGFRCAVGCLIPDDEYSPDFERASVSCIVGKVPSLDGVSMNLLIAMQHVHDNHEVYAWEAQFSDVAECYGLKLPEAQP